MRAHRESPRTVTAIAAALALALGAAAQQPAPAGEAASPVQVGERLLAIEDPVGAQTWFRQALTGGPPGLEVAFGLGRSHLMLGESWHGGRYADLILDGHPEHQGAMALSVRCAIRAREFDGAVLAAELFVRRTAAPGADLLAARASALFRVQRTEEAGTEYLQVVRLDAQHAEAHLRLGSGLLAPTTVTIDAALRQAVAERGRGRLDAAAQLLQAVLAEQPQNPIAHRLLGEVLFAQRELLSMASNDDLCRELMAALRPVDLGDHPAAEFVAGYASLSPERRRAADRALALFARHLKRLVALGGKHDLLGELERTTDATPRQNLRGKRTFDGRVWDDVRGIGGLRAATGIEALDEAAAMGFDTLAHELSHQVHYYSFRPVQREHIRALYEAAKERGRFLDYYAASNEAEYFGQGVEAFAALAKRPNCETTHGHTRFELFRVDPDLYDFIRTMVDYDPLEHVADQRRLLPLCVEVALRTGRPADALTAAQWLEVGAQRDELVARAEAALLRATSW